MNGKLLVISGLSAAGKGTIAKELLGRFDNYVLSISATTRERRGQEVDGKDYFFVSKDKFKEMIDKNELLEYAKYVDNYYGTPKKYVLDKLNEGKNVILEIEMQGALKVKEIYKDAVLVFFMPRTAKIQRERLVSRGRETEEQINERQQQAVIDAGYAKQYDYILINDTIDGSVDEMEKVVNGTFDKNKNKENLEILDKLVRDIKEKNYV